MMTMQVSLPVVLMAFVMVLLSVLAFIPFMLYALNLQDVSQGGWSATEAALFAAMIASTDAASVISILKSGVTAESRRCCHAKVGMAGLCCAATPGSGDSGGVV